jgi:DNA-binding IscR family transcriptional regulator
MTTRGDRARRRKGRSDHDQACVVELMVALCHASPRPLSVQELAAIVHLGERETQRALASLVDTRLVARCGPEYSQFSLQRPAHEITVVELLQARHTRPAQGPWRRIHSAISAALRETSLSELVRLGAQEHL